MSQRVIIGLLILVLLAGCNLGSSTPAALQDAQTAPTTIPLPTPVATSAPTNQVTADTATQIPIVAPSKPITLPPGFTISVYAQNIGKARGLALDDQGRVYVTDIGGRVLRLSAAPNEQGLHTAEAIAQGLDQPHGITFHGGALYVGETNQVVRFKREGEGWAAKEVIVPNLPTGGHRTRTVLFGSDGKLYVSIGSSCNVCEEDNALRASVWQYNADGSEGRLFTKGLRNAVGLALRPGSNEIWATNNGRDMLGDDLPPETINVLADGADFGWPRCHAGRIVDPEYGGAKGCEGVVAPAIEMQAHSAPLGLTFYTAQQFPAAYRGNLFVAFHGSWNRSDPTGYKIVRIPVDATGKAGVAQDFAVGWLESNGDSWGRPVDMLVLPDGSLLVSDDAGQRLFRISYQE